MAKKTSLEQWDENIKLTEKLYEEEQERLKDPAYRKATELVEAAWDFVFSRKNFNPEKAVELIKEAASLHSPYESKIEAIKKEIERKKRKGPVNIKRTVNRFFTPKALEWGFEIFTWDGKGGLSQWSRDDYFLRKENDIQITIRMGADKFGNKFGVLCTKKVGDGDYEHFEFKLKDEDMEYLNQRELNEVLKKVTAGIEENLNSWFLR